MVRCCLFTAGWLFRLCYKANTHFHCILSSGKCKSFAVSLEETWLRSIYTQPVSSHTGRQHEVRRDFLLFPPKISTFLNMNHKYPSSQKTVMQNLSLPVGLLISFFFLAVNNRWITITSPKAISQNDVFSLFFLFVLMFWLLFLRKHVAF